MDCGIYRILNSDSGDIYIGSSCNLKSRLRTHKSMLKRNVHHSVHLQNAYNKYKKDSFKFNILFFCDVEDLLFYEQRLLDYYKPRYNISSFAGAAMAPGTKLSQEVIDKRTVALRLVMGTKEYRDKQSIACSGKLNGFYGKTHSEETKKKLSELGKKRLPIPITEHTREILRRKASGNKHNLGHKHSPETKKKISSAQCIYWIKNRMYRPKDIIGLTVNEAVESLGISRAHYYRLRNGERNKAL